MILVGFNLLTIALYLFPPVVRHYTNSILVVIYLLLSVLLIYRGLKKGFNRAYSIQVPNVLSKCKYLNFFLVFYSATLLFKYGYLMGLSPFDIQGMIARISIGIANPDLGYMMSLEEGISSVPWSVFFLISIINDFFFVIMFCSWKDLNKFSKVLIITFCVFEVFFWLGRGTNFGVITMITNILFSYLLVGDMGDWSKQKIKSTKTIIVIACAFIGSLMIFSYLMVGRTGGGDSDQSLENITTNQQIDYNNPIVKVLPEDMLASYYFIYSYCCQGYEALGKGMDGRVCFTWGMGNNPRLMSLALFLTGYDAMEDSYMTELDKSAGVDRFAAWHSAYLWWANDFTIPGTLLIIYLLSYLCGCSVSLSIFQNDFLSKVICVALSNMLLFLFANNTYLALTFYCSMFIFPYWYYTRLYNK